MSAGSMKQVSVTSLLMIVVSDTAFCERIPDRAVEQLVRQASYVVRGEVLKDNKVKILQRYKGAVRDQVISVPDILEFHERVIMQAKHTSLARDLKQDGISMRNVDRMRESGVVGQEVVLLLSNQNGDYVIHGKSLRNVSNYKHSGFKVIIDGKVFGFR